MSANQCLNIASASAKALEMVTASWPEATAEDVKLAATYIIRAAPALVLETRCVEHNAQYLVEALAANDLIPAWVG